MAMETLGGYRIIRKLGEGGRAQVQLAHADDAEQHPVALKIYRDGVSLQSVLTEIEALHLAAGPHVQRLLDVAPDRDGRPALVLERLPAGGLDGLLHRREHLAAGEAITILAPLAGALARLHDAGVQHGGVTAGAVLFDAEGAPVLTGFGRARLVAAGMSMAARDAEPGFAADLGQFAALAREVLDRVPGEASRVLREPGDLRDFAERLFSLGDASAVSLEAPGMPAPLPSRLVRADPVPLDAPQEQPPSRPSAALGLPEWILSRIPADLPARLDRLREALAPVRPRVWLAAGAIALALVVALVLMPSGGDPVAGPVPSASPVVTAEPDDSPVSGDDPLAALDVLLAARERCIREVSVLCLDAVDQAGSAALADDQALIRSLQDGAELPTGPDAGSLTLVERLGDSAIVALGGDSEPASVLLMKGEAGWRIRQYLPG
jgi:hypothetical protein